jgi:hypothetical protein
MSTESSTPETPGSASSAGSVGGFMPPADADGSQIVAMQDDTKSLDLLAARFDRYGHAARLLGWQFGIMLTTVGLAVSRLFFGPGWGHAADILVLSTLFLELVLDERQATAREEGAGIQEEFDRRLYHLPWPTGWIDRPGPEMIALWSCAGRHRASESEQTRWRSWYPAAVARLPLPLARLACQRANAWWDSNQRREYAQLLLSAGGISLVIILAMAIIPDMSRETVGNGVMVWLPVPYWLMREGLRHRKAARERECALQRAQAALESAGEGPLHVAGATRHAEEIQTALFGQRRTGPLVPSWFYRLHRPTKESAMIAGAEDVVAHWRGSRPGPLGPQRPTCADEADSRA